MIYPLITLADHTEIVFSKITQNQTVKVYIEQPNASDCFHHATCYLPAYQWEDIYGFDETQIQRFENIIRLNEKMIYSIGYVKKN